jgi:hypothetical protein
MRELLVELYIDFVDRSWLTQRDREVLPKDYLCDCLEAMTAKLDRDSLVQSLSNPYDYRNFQYTPEAMMGHQG